MKKLISIILTVVILLTTVITVNAASFNDVKSSDWFAPSVNYVADKGIMQGTSSTKFSPKASLTRAMGVTLLYRVAGSPSVSGITLPFNDVKGGTWYTDAVKWAYKNGIITGKSATYFDTNGNITRAEFATILNRYSDFMKYTFSANRADFVTDVAKIPSWAFAAVNTMYKAEIINGRDGGIFDPNAKITRAEAAAMIERFMKAPKDGSNNSDTTPDTQPPVETPEVPTTGKLVVKEKKYDYNGANVMILNVENQTSQNLNVTISAKYLDASGKILYAENRSIEGFPANYRNYVVLQPGIKFDKFTYEVKTESFNGTAYAKYLAWDSNTTAIPWAYPRMPGGGSYPSGEERASIQFTVRFRNTYNDELYVKYDIVYFDNNDEIYYIGFYNGTITNKYTTEENRTCPFHDILYKDFIFPETLKGDLNVVMGLTRVELEMD